MTSKAIITRYLGPTNTKGARIVASDGDGNRITVPYSRVFRLGSFDAANACLIQVLGRPAAAAYELSDEAVHRVAAQALCEKMGWPGKLVAGSLKDGYAFVFVD